MARGPSNDVSGSGNERRGRSTRTRGLANYKRGRQQKGPFRFPISKSAVLQREDSRPCYFRERTADRATLKRGRLCNLKERTAIK